MDSMMGMMKRLLKWSNVPFAIIFFSLMFGIVYFYENWTEYQNESNVTQKSVTELSYVDDSPEFVTDVPLISDSTTDKILQLNPKLDKKIAEIIAESIDSKVFPKEIIISLIFRESSFNPLAESSAKCIGLMQINPKAHPDKVEGYGRDELFQIDTNIKIGVQILEEYYEQTGCVRKALTKYLGKNNQSYINDVLTNYANLTISTF